MPDAYDSASQNIDQHHRAMLTAMAQGGQAGLDAHNAAQAQLAAQREQAVNAALAQAAHFNAPAHQRTGLEAQVSDPYNRWQADLTAQQGYRQAAMSQLQSMYDTYFSQAQAAIPALRTYSQAAAQDAALERESKMLDLERKRREAEEGSSFIGQLNKQFGSVAGGNRALLAAAKQYVEQSGGTWGRAGTTALLERFDQEAGLPTGYTRALLPPKGSGDQGKLTQQAQRTRTTDAIARKHGADSKTFETFSGLVNNSKNYADAVSFLNDLYAADDELIQTPGGGGKLNKTLLTTYLRSYYA